MALAICVPLSLLLLWGGRQLYREGMSALAGFAVLAAVALVIVALRADIELAVELWHRTPRMFSTYGSAFGGAALFCYHERMALFTGKGDGGTTKLFDTPQGVRVTKSSPIFECLGQLDELNTLIGWCKVACPDDFTAEGRSVKTILHEVQDHLFTIQAEAAGAQKTVPAGSTESVSTLINAIEKELPEIKTFLVPGGTELSARLDIARAVSRRAERRLVALHESGERVIAETSRTYANRLSSLLYALVRLANHRAGVAENPPHYKA